VVCGTFTSLLSLLSALLFTTIGPKEGGMNSRIIQVTSHEGRTHTCTSAVKRACVVVWLCVNTFLWWKQSFPLGPVLIWRAAHTHKDTHITSTGTVSEREVWVSVRVCVYGVLCSGSVNSSCQAPKPPVYIQCIPHNIDDPKYSPQ
jgi:hypothetical protein